MTTLAASDFLLFLGRFHPLVLHLPIGLLAGAAALEALGMVMHKLPRLRRLFTEIEHKADGALGIHLPGLEGATRLTLALAALSAVVAAALGLMLASTGQFSGENTTNRQERFDRFTSSASSHSLFPLPGQPVMMLICPGTTV